MRSHRAISAAILGFGSAALFSVAANAGCGGCGGYEQVYAPPAIYVQPQPIYVQPQPVYVQQPVYVPQPVYVEKRVYVPQPVAVPVPTYPPVNECAARANGFLQYLVELSDDGNCAARMVAPARAYAPPAYESDAAYQDAPVYQRRHAYYPRRPLVRERYTRYSEPTSVRRHGRERIIRANAVVRVHNERMDIVLTRKRGHR